MKKILTIVLTVLLLSSMIVSMVSCGGSADAKKVKVIDIALTEEEYAFAVQKGDSEMLASLNAFLTEITNNGKFAEIVNKYFGDGTPKAVQSAAAKKTDGSQLIVATNAAFAPFEYMVGNNFYGLDLEIMELFAEKLGLELYIDNMEFDAVCLSVSSAGGTYEDESGNEVAVTGGSCNIAAAGLTVTDTRKEILDFSTSYYNACQVLIVPESNTDFDACKTAADVENVLKAKDKSFKVGTQNGTTGFFYCTGDEDWGFDGYAFETKGYANGALAVQDMINGNINLVVIDEGPAKEIAKNYNDAN
ncbi:MAG: transporter substrate-binding domain-containing protein [Clostridia bacterium]|nr:transporter substrate-binding domain-containing protein [Clostridia bacterium]